MWWHTVTHRGKWRGNWWMEWVASTLHTTSEHGVSRITTADAHISAAIVERTDAPADLNGLVCFAERRNLVSARVPSHFKRSLQSSGHRRCSRFVQNYFCLNRDLSILKIIVITIDLLAKSSFMPSVSFQIIFKQWNYKMLIIRPISTYRYSTIVFY